MKKGEKRGKKGITDIIRVPCLSYLWLAINIHGVHRSSANRAKNKTSRRWKELFATKCNFLTSRSFYARKQLCSSSTKLRQTRKPLAGTRWQKAVHANSRSNDWTLFHSSLRGISIICVWPTVVAIKSPNKFLSSYLQASTDFSGILVYLFAMNISQFLYTFSHWLQISPIWSWFPCFVTTRMKF